MIINNKEINPEDINEEFLTSLPSTHEKDVRKIMGYIRKTIAIRCKQLESEGVKDAINVARREAKQRFGNNWRDCMLTRTLYNAPKYRHTGNSDWCPEEDRDFGYPNWYWK